MIPETWTPVRRGADDELVGYLESAPTGSIPRLLTGSALDDAHPRTDAISVLETRGLPELDRVHWARLPHPLPAGRFTAATPERDWHWTEVVILDVTDAECRVRPRTTEAGAPESIAVLPVPVAGLLRREAPER